MALLDQRAAGVAQQRGALPRWRRVGARAPSAPRARGGPWRCRSGGWPRCGARRRWGRPAARAAAAGWATGRRTSACRRRPQGRRGRLPSLTRRRTWALGSWTQRASVASVGCGCCTMNGRMANSAEKRCVSACRQRRARGTSSCPGARRTRRATRAPSRDARVSFSLAQRNRLAQRVQRQRRRQAGLDHVRRLREVPAAWPPAHRPGAWRGP
jgi:hypothetical protein